MAQVRYVKQRNHYSCGPIAIMNVLKWTGKQCSYADMQDKLAALCECAPSYGTLHKKFDEALRKTAKTYGNFKVKKVIRPTLARIEKHLREGGALVLNYTWEYDGDFFRHFSVVVGVSDSGRSFRIVNGRHKNRTVTWIHRDRFKHWEQRFQRVDKSHKAWFVSLQD